MDLGEFIYDYEERDVRVMIGEYEFVPKVVGIKRIIVEFDLRPEFFNKTNPVAGTR